MRRNSHLIGRSDLLATIVEKIEREYSQDIALLICYGSFVTGDYGATSDIDFFLSPGRSGATSLETSSYSIRSDTISGLSPGTG